MNPDLPTQLPANVDNAPAALGAARYPQANNCMDKSYAASNTKFKTRPEEANPQDAPQTQGHSFSYKGSRAPCESSAKRSDLP
jgi:hypothetical protein